MAKEVSGEKRGLRWTEWNSKQFTITITITTATTINKTNTNNERSGQEQSITPRIRKARLGSNLGNQVNQTRQERDDLRTHGRWHYQQW